MKSILKAAVIKSSISILLLTFLTVGQSLAMNAVDSDLSNSAGSNSGKDHTGLYIFLCLFLVLAAVVPYFEKRSKEKELQNR